MKKGEGHRKFWSEFGNGFKKLTTPSSNFSGSTVPPPFFMRKQLPSCDHFLLHILCQVSAKIIIQGGHPGAHVCEVASKHNAAFIVCGSRGMGTVRRTILGSTSDYIIHHAGVPVVVVPKEKKHSHHSSPKADKKH